MTISALNLALKLVVLHVDLESVKHEVLCDALVEVSGTHILFHWIRLKNFAYKHVNYNIVSALYLEIPGGGSTPPQPMYIRKKSPNWDRVNSIN